MIGTLSFTPNLAFGLLELRNANGGVEVEIPSWLVDHPDVLQALAAIAEAGGTKFVNRGLDSEDVVVDLATRKCSFVEPTW